MAHPVRPDQYQAIDNFYTATVYEKGSEVVRMMHTLVGREGFAAGMSLYFERHDGQAVTCDDFAQAMADANPDSALARHLGIFKRWYAQAGTPRLNARGAWNAEAATYTLTLSQQLPDTPGQRGKQTQLIPVALGLLTREGQALPLQLQGEDAPQGTERVLVLTEAEQSFTFIGITADVVPSLLRNFSAPVVLDDGLTDADLLVLLAHDSDAFNRWEAGQRLALNRILAALRAGQPLVLSNAFIEAMRGVLNHAELDPAFKELALTLPGESYIAEQLDVVDPQAIHAAVMAAQTQLASALRDDWAAAFEAHQVQGGYTPDPVSAGKRALANLALSMLVLHATRSGDSVWPGRAYQRFKDASNMTDRLGALSALVNESTFAAIEKAVLSKFPIPDWFASIYDKGLFFREFDPKEPVATGGRWFAALVARVALALVLARSMISWKVTILYRPLYCCGRSASVEMPPRVLISARVKSLANQPVWVSPSTWVVFLRAANSGWLATSVL